MSADLTAAVWYVPAIGVCAAGVGWRWRIGEESGVDGMLRVAVVGVLILAALGLFAVIDRRRFVRMFFRPLLAACYRKRVVGMEHFPKQGGCVVVCNHVSWVDGILLLWMLPRNVRFIVDAGNFRHGFLEWVSNAFGTILMSSGPKSIAGALKTGRQAVADGDVVGLFPEGTISRTGQVQAFKPGLGRILRDSSAPVIPLYLDGMWGSIFSFSSGKFFFKWPQCGRLRLTLYVGEPMSGETPLDKIRGRVERMGARAAIERRERLPLLPSRLIRGWRKAGRRTLAADSTGVEIGGRAMLIRTLALRRMLRREVISDDERYVGVLLPPSVAGVVVNAALALDRRVSANLNYTAPSRVINHCTEQLGVRHVLTSEKFMSKLDLRIDAETVLLESLRDRVTTLDKLVAAFQGVLLPAAVLDRVLGLHRVAADDLLTVIFTSGSTGTPKGVMLSHANVSHNVEAIRQMVALTSDDTVLGILPFFHSFGYSVTLWAGMTLGPTCVYHFNPLDAKQIGKLAEKYRATVLLGTPTFLRGYLRRVEPEQFAAMEVVVAGAEKMPADLFESFEKRFGVRPVEGYGATELSPLVSVNVPPNRSAAKFQIDRREGSVGRAVPGVAARIVSVDDGQDLGAGQDGMLWITGPNVMRGYHGLEEKTAEVVQDGWYNTGDIAQIDDEGFIHITGRLSRFSKIGGEMVPHIQVEEAIADLLRSGEDDEELRVCVTSVQDEKKGERLIVLHTPTEKDPQEIRQGLRDAGLSNLYVPAADSFFEVDEIPVLGTGKLDIQQARQQAEELTAART